MDRTAWIVVTACLVLLGVNFWYSTPDTPPTATTPPAAVSQADPTVPVSGDEAASPVEAAAPAPVAAKPQQIAELVSKNSAGEPVARFRFQDKGGSLASVDMLGKAINSTKPELHGDVSINSQAAHGIGTFLFGLSADAAPRVDETVYHVVSQTENEVTLEGKLGDLTIRKVYTLKPLVNGDKTTEGNAYCLHLSVQVTNEGTVARQAQNWGIYAGAAGSISDDEPDRYTYYIRHENGDFRKESIGSFTPFFGSSKARIYTTDAKKIGWGGVMNQYYATLVYPVNGNDIHTYYAAPLYNLAIPGKTDGPGKGVEFAVGVPTFTLSAATAEKTGGAATLEYDIFTGPKLNLMLSDMAHEFPKIGHIMDYGIFHIISYPMNWLINVFYGWFGNWGWAIVAMTFVVRLLIWPLYRKSYMSMKSMSLLQPKIKELREKYPNDQQKVSMEMMKLYREYGISPMGGCLPMFLQIPIFFSFFYVLQTAAEFRGAPFIGWVTDLSQMDTICTVSLLGYNLPINVLPILMAVSMMLQMSMSPQAGDPMQQRIMRFMPLIFFAVCYTFPSALALYWTTTNIISIIQTWIIRRMPQPELKKVDRSKGGSRKKGFFERMAEAQQAALAEQQRQAANRRK